MADPEIASYDEALRMLTELARKGHAQSAIELAKHLRRGKEPDGDDKGPRSIIDELAGRRTA